LRGTGQGVNTGILQNRINDTKFEGSELAKLMGGCATRIDEGMIHLIQREPLSLVYGKQAGISEIAFLPI